jgi:hypothetical protein
LAAASSVECVAARHYGLIMNPETIAKLAIAEQL